MRTALMIGLAAASVAMAAPASGQLTFQPYLELGFGAGKMDASDAHLGGTTLSEGTEGAMALSLGLKDVLGPFDLRLDAYESSIYDPAVTSYVASVDVNSWYLDLLYTHEVSDRLELYAGAGAGKAELSYSGCYLCLPTVLVEGVDEAFSWQALAGARFKVAGGFGLFAEARYMSADGFLINESDTSDPLQTVDYPTDYREITALGGIRWQF